MGSTGSFSGSETAVGGGKLSSTASVRTGDDVALINGAAAAEKQAHTPNRSQAE